MAGQICRCPILADDAFQDAVVTLITSLSGYRGDAPLRAWLRRLLQTACGRLRRGRRNNPAYNVPLDAVAGEPEWLAEEPSQEQRLLRAERRALLHRALHRIEPLNRRLLLEHEGADHSIDEIALDAGLSQDAVKSRLKRTRALLKRRLRTTDVFFAPPHAPPVDPRSGG